MITMTGKIDRKMVDEIYTEKDKVMYWANRKITQKFSSQYKKMIEKTVLNKKLCLSEPIEYNSPNKNKWIHCFITDYIQNKLVHADVSFCYQETIGSVAAVFPLYHFRNNFGLDNPKAVIRFNSHFFYQMSERSGITYKSKDMIIKFIELISSFNVNVAEEEKENVFRIDIIFNNDYIGRGYAFVNPDDNTIIFEIRTFLKKSQLSYSQLKKINHVFKKDNANVDFIKNIEKRKEAFVKFIERPEEEITEEELDCIFFDLMHNVYTTFHMMTMNDFDFELFFHDITEKQKIHINSTIKNYITSRKTDLYSLIIEVADILKINMKNYPEMTRETFEYMFSKSFKELYKTNKYDDRFKIKIA